MNFIKPICTIFFATLLGFNVLAKEKPVKVFILAGQSNMEGKGGIDPLLNHQIKAPETKAFYAHLHKDGKNIERDEVWMLWASGDVQPRL